MVAFIDEATSALDATSRVLVFEAIKHVRRRKTTVVITHDLSQITPEDFVYFMRNGTVVEEGYREDLEKLTGGEFRKTVEKQVQNGFPVKDTEDVYATVQKEAVNAVDRLMASSPAEAINPRNSIAWVARHSMVGAALTGPSGRAWEVDAIQDIIGPSRPPPLAAPKKHLAPTRVRGRYQSSSARPLSAFPTESYPLQDVSEFTYDTTTTLNASTTSLPSPAPEQQTFPSLASRRSMTFEPSHYPSSERRPSLASSMADDDSFDAEKLAMENSAQYASRRRFDSEHVPTPRRSNWDISAITIPGTDEKETSSSPKEEPLPSLIQLMRQYYHTVPMRGQILLGLIFSAANGALTPVFSYLLARLLSQVGGSGEHHTSDITFWALLVLLVAFGDGLANGLKFYLLENAAMAWVVSLRKRCFALILRQDKAWFDESEHSAERMVQVLVKDGDDARTLIATIIGQILVVFTMVTVGLVWALVQGWQLTLVGMAIGPIFAGAMMIQSVITSKFELKNKRAREDVARRYYEVRCVFGFLAQYPVADDGSFAGYLQCPRDPLYGAGVGLRSSL